jgi:predicted dehydrogenase
MCVHNWKHAPAYRRAYELIAAGRLGRVREIRLERLRTGPAGGDGPGARWRREPALGGGILIDHGWHALYLVQWLMGGEAPRLIASRLEAQSERGAEEAARLELGFADGRRAEINLSWRAGVRRTAATITGERAMLAIEGDSLRLTEAGREQDLSVADAPDDSYHSAWFGALAAEFERAVAAGGGPIMETNLAEARCALAIILAARSSAAAGG